MPLLYVETTKLIARDVSNGEQYLPFAKRIRYSFAFWLLFCLQLSDDNLFVYITNKGFNESVIALVNGNLNQSSVFFSSQQNPLMYTQAIFTLWTQLSFG